MAAVILTPAMRFRMHTFVRLKLWVGQAEAPPEIDQKKRDEACDTDGEVKDDKDEVSLPAPSRTSDLDVPMVSPTYL